MPKSTSPKKPFQGNKFILTSREYRVLSERLNDVVGQLRQTQIALLALAQQFHAPAVDVVVPPEMLEAANEPVCVDEAAEVTPEMWDAIPSREAV